MTTEELLKKAQAAGVDCEVQDCKACKGKGKFVRPDPLDLQRLREGHGASQYAFAKFAGVHPGMVKMVESTDPKKSRPCSERLLLAYLKIPAETWTPGKKQDPSGLRGRTLSEQRQILKARREARVRRLEAKEAAIHVRKGQIWEKGGTRYEVLQVLDLPGAKEPSALLRRLDLEAAQPFTARVSIVVAKYQKIEEAA